MILILSIGIQIWFSNVLPKFYFYTNFVSLTSYKTIIDKNKDNSLVIY